MGEQRRVVLVDGRRRSPIRWYWDIPKRLILQAAIALLGTLLVQLVWAQDKAGDFSELGKASGESQSGFDDLHRFGGPRSVTAILKRNDAKRDSQFGSLALDAYFDWKGRIKTNYGLAIGAQLLTLYQQASSSLDGEDSDAFGYTFRVLGNWRLMGRDTENFGRIGFRIENRSNLGSYQSPVSLGPAIGVVALGPGFGFPPNFETDMSVLHWSQGFAGGRTSYAIGRLDYAVFLDASPSQAQTTGLLNRAFIFNPTLPLTGIGSLGAVVNGFLTENVWVGAQFHDANAVSGEFDIDTAERGEWIKALEIGITPGFEQRFIRRAMMTIWEVDARPLSGLSRGRGWAINAAWQINGRILPFVRAGYSDGGGGVSAERAISAGVGIRLGRGSIWSMGAGWSKPSRETFGADLRDESVIEMSYKIQLLRNLSMTPDLQVIFNPANDTSRSSVRVWGLRFSATL